MSGSDLIIYGVVPHFRAPGGLGSEPREKCTAKLRSQEKPSNFERNLSELSIKRRKRRTIYQLLIIRQRAAVARNAILSPSGGPHSPRIIFKLLEYCNPLRSGCHQFSTAACLEHFLIRIVKEKASGLVGPPICSHPPTQAGPRPKMASIGHHCQAAWQAAPRQAMPFEEFA